MDDPEDKKPEVSLSSAEPHHFFLPLHQASLLTASGLSSFPPLCCLLLAWTLSSRVLNVYGVGPWCRAMMTSPGDRGPRCQEGELLDSSHGAVWRLYGSSLGSSLLADQPSLS